MNISNEPIDQHPLQRVLGIDESGKGDFFGPLVIAGVLADEKGALILQRAGVKDSKKVTDKKILELSVWIAGNFPNSVVTIGPEKYNQLYSQIGNLNKLLAWGHSRIIENMANEHEIELAISDKFGRTEFIERALMEKGKKIKLLQQVRAESIPQVAAASILARAGFIKYMDKLSRQFNLELPKGAGDPVDKAAGQFISKYGVESLTKVAKIHFRNFKKVVG